ncbi:AraC family transcriptional regulator [Ancylobacter vacuolatus]|uniref:AraC-like DNA-binding protein n=1 Tax=Ancylobacter vacuolatus TaxID=223389 RepID=A0ABU0DNV6_9HYPH|nr:AraC family transcriptional regulator [Ancylobacter vacuolatus]MDQ0349963.1 AraC-like DNA-binding protein [Ancylobacter vacuolatus]
MKSRSRPASRIPPLAFGSHTGLEFTDAEQMSEVLTRAGTATTLYRPTGRDTPFLSRAAMLRAGKARLVASASSPVQFDAGGASIGILMVPFHGLTMTRCDGRSLEWGAARSAVFLPPGGCSGQSSARSVVGIDIEPGVLGEILHGMLGDQRAADLSPAADFTTPRALGLALLGVDFSQLLFQHIALMNAMNGDPERITRSGVDDAVLRAALLLLQPELFFAEQAKPAPHARGLNMACDYIDANLAGRITLSDLERVSGLSARSLQYAFRATFNRSPLQWTTDRRLEKVRELILSARSGDTLTVIAGAYFTNPGDFSRFYRARYGELPSQTLQKVLAQPLRS